VESATGGEIAADRGRHGRPESTTLGISRALTAFSPRWPATCLNHRQQHAEVHKLLLITQPVQMTLVSIGLEGKLIGAWVGETRRIVATASASNLVCLNLQGLTFADSRGIELLRTLRREGIPLLGCSPLIEGLLAANGVSANANPSSTARGPDDKDIKCP
jgi:hypothetical protein